MLFALCALAVTCTGCGTMNKMFTKKKAEKAAEAAKETAEAPKQDMAIGLIEMVNPEQHFILVRTESRMTLAPGTKLITQPQNGTKSTFIVTPESKQNFISADIVEGFPKRGEVVILPVAGQPVPLTATPGPPGQLNPPTSSEAMVPGMMPGQTGQPPGAALPPPAATPPPVPVPPPTTPVRPATKAPSVKVPSDVKGSINAPVDPLPPPL